MQDSWTRVFVFALFLFFSYQVDALPKKAKGTTQQSTRGTGPTSGTTAAAAAGGITTAKDGSTILDKTVQIKISATATSFTAASGVAGGTAAPNTTGTAGLNVLLHGDGSQSFFDFPNYATQDNLMGVVGLAPNKNMLWGGGSGLDRTDGVAHAAAVNSLIQTQLSQDVAFNSSNVFFTGVVLGCGALTPQVDIVDPTTLASSMKIHFQSTKDKLALLQPAIPAAISAYEKIATDAGLSTEQIGQMQTVDNTPNGGGHCGFDGTGFVKGVQTLSSGYNQILGTNASGVVTGIQGNVLRSVVGNEKVVFTSAGQAQRMMM